MGRKPVRMHKSVWISGCASLLIVLGVFSASISTFVTIPWLPKELLFPRGCHPRLLFCLGWCETIIRIEPQMLRVAEGEGELFSAP